ncbi:oxytocin receptor-like [Oppia nitens]|uniref:oxytocin receptor-like n=1 Tax=Oppia nitens TaxID=1686743 RepID=UPI0023DBF1E7|nr:oxytocin receptor-like [Oppia nitens]
MSNYTELSVFDNIDNNNSNSNYSNSSEVKNLDTSNRDENLAIMEVIVLAIIFVLIIVGNICVLIALAVRRFKMTRMYYFLLHLVISDIMTGCFTVMPQLAWDITHRFNGGNILCKSVKFMQLFGPYLSSYVLVVTAIDRYQAICYPLSNCKWTSRKSKLMITIAWMISILCSAPQAFIFSYQEIPGNVGVYDCWATFSVLPAPWGERIYVTWYTVTVFFIPLIIITYTYVYICYEVWSNVRHKRQTLKPEISFIEMRKTWMRNETQGKHDDSCDSTTDNSFSADDSNSYKVSANVSLNPRTHSIYRLSKAKIKTVKVTVVVVICYIVCSSPFICVQVWANWWPGAQQTDFWRGKIVTIVMLLSSLNSTVNPWIYLLFNPNLMKALQNFCCCGRQPTGHRLRTGRAGSRVNSTINTKLDSDFTRVT